MGTDYKVKISENETSSLELDFDEVSHLLVFGTVGSGKTELIRYILLQLCAHNTKEEFQFFLYDSKYVEYMDIRKDVHAVNYGGNNVVEFIGALQKEVSRRIKASRSERSLLNESRLLIVIDGVDTTISETELEMMWNYIPSLLLQARHLKINVIISSTLPYKTIIPQSIKSPIPNIISFKVVSKDISVAAISKRGAESLGYPGEFIYVGPLGEYKGYTTFDESIKAEDIIVIDNSKNDDVVTDIGVTPQSEEVDVDELFEEAVNVVLEQGGASTSMLQRKLRLGYARASLIIDQMEDAGIIGPSEGSKTRQILITKQQWLEREL
ncbi:MAG: DNA translocase FtsK [Oscillospiraceae bacterium]|nr:DNA translocase FtsK [Oscillospiraceae bacterium]